MSQELPDIAPGCLLLTPPDVGERARDVLCAFDADPSEADALFALVLNRPTSAPAQPLAFALFGCGEERAWWGGPTTEPFALLEFAAIPEQGAVRPDGSPRPFVTRRTAVFFPGRDHAPVDAIARRRVFHGSVWLPPDEARLYREQGTVVRATDDDLFDTAPDTLADRLRTRQAAA